MSVDLSDSIFNGTFDVAITFTPKAAPSTPVPNLRGIFSNGNTPGRESGKGLTSAIRGVQASFSRVLVKQSEIPIQPVVHDTINDGTTDWDIQSSEDTGAGTWRCICKHSVEKRRQR